MSSNQERTGDKAHSSENITDPHHLREFAGEKGFEGGAPSTVASHTVTLNGYIGLVKYTYADFVGSDFDLAEEVPYSLFLYYHIFILWYRLLSIFHRNGHDIGLLRHDRDRLGTLGSVGLSPVIRAYLLGLGNLSTRGGWQSRLVPSLDLSRLTRAQNQAGAHIGQPLNGEDCMGYLNCPLPYIAARGVQLNVHRSIVDDLNAADDWNTELDPNGPVNSTNCRLTEDVLGFAKLTPMAWGTAQHLATLGWGEQAFPTDIAGSTLGVSLSTLSYINHELLMKGETFKEEPITTLDSDRGSQAQMVLNWYPDVVATQVGVISDTCVCSAVCEEQLAGRLWKSGNLCQYQVIIPKDDLRGSAFYGCGWFFQKPNGELVPAAGLTPAIYTARFADPGTAQIIGSQFRLAGVQRGRTLTRVLSRSTVAAAPPV